MTTGSAAVPAADVAASRRHRPRRPQYLLPPRYRLMVVAFLVLFASIAYYVVANPEAQPVLRPMLAIVNLAVFFVAILYKRDGELPVFESGTLWVLATMMYSVYPLFNFLVSNLRWYLPSDYRLVAYDPSPSDMGTFAGNHVLYLATFVVAYLVLRGRHRVPRVFAPVKPAVQTAVIVTFVVMMILVQMVQYIVLPPEASISPYEGGNFAYRADVPLIFQQFLNIGTNALLALKMIFAILLLARWRERKWRVILYLWIPLEFFLITRSYSRAPFVLLLLTMGIAYHRLVRPLTLRMATFAGITLVAGFLAFGIYRDTRGRSDIDFRTALRSNNEFQGLFGNAYDIYMRRKLGVLPVPPPQMKWSELYMVIPSQLLPFYKAEPNEWYAEVLGISETGVRAMFGVIAQAMLGYGTIEVFLRALLIAVILALVHRWYARRAERFWPTALYAYISIWTFYTFRSTTLTPLYFVVYFFGAAVFLVAIVKVALSVQRRGLARLRRSE